LSADPARVLGKGSHAALVKKGGPYARLAKQQSLDGDASSMATVA